MLLLWDLIGRRVIATDEVQASTRPGWDKTGLSFCRVRINYGGFRFALALSAAGFALSLPLAFLAALLV